MAHLAALPRPTTVVAVLRHRSGPPSAPDMPHPVNDLVMKNS
jgi:hypothetical protein